MLEQLHIQFNHGLGDCCNMAALATLYRRHGIPVVVSGEDNKRFIWMSAGLDPEAVHGPSIKHPWLHPGGFWNVTTPDHDNHKTAGNINISPLPTLNMTREPLWRELCGIDLDAAPYIPSTSYAEAANFLEGLPGPIVAIHAEGTNSRGAKRIDGDTQIELQRMLVEHGCSVVVLDFDSRAAQVGHDRIRGIKPGWGHISLDRLAALLSKCALLVGVDSGPLHFARMFCRVPCLGVFLNREALLPHRVAIPSPRLTCLVPSELNDVWRSRINDNVGWQFIDYPNATPMAADIVQAATSIIQGSPLGLTAPTVNNVAAGMYIYERVGYDSREMELKLDGKVGIGSAERERRWITRDSGGKSTLSILDDHGESTCDMIKADDGTWRGRWKRFERMPVILKPKHGPGAAATPAVARPLTSTTYDEKYYQEHCDAGLDYLNFGPWQQNYGRWLAVGMKWDGSRVLDVGCACGSILRGLGEAGIVVEGIDLSEHMISLGRSKWPDMATLLHQGDAADLSRFDSGRFDGIHSAQVAEHWDPAAVPQILRELSRITKNGGTFFCALDTQELFDRQGRTKATDDPTHLCIRPMEWWQDQLSQAGWEDVSHEFEGGLLDQPELKFVQQYDWDWFVARKVTP